jgi:hypothetical protein
MSLRRHFEDHKEGKAHEWATFRREPGEELPALLSRLQSLARDLVRDKDDQELVTKFITSLDRRLAEQISAQAMAATERQAGPYTLEEAYDAAIQVQAMSTRLRIARELAPRPAEAKGPKAGAAEAERTKWREGAAATHGASSTGRHAGHWATRMERPWVAAAGPVAGGGPGVCHNCGEAGHYKNGCPYPRHDSLGAGRQRGPKGVGVRGASRACYVCGQLGHLAAQCAGRVKPPGAVAAAASVETGELEAVNAEEFQAFREWRAAIQAAEGADEWKDGGCALGAIALPTLVGGKGFQLAAMGTRTEAREGEVKRGSQWGLRRGLESRSSADPRVVSTRRGCLAGVSREERGQVTAEAGPTSWQGGCRESPEGFCTRPGATALAGPADAKSSGGIFVGARGQTGQRPQSPEARMCVAPPRQDQQAGFGPVMKKGSGDAFDGAVEVNIGVLLELASGAGIHLEDVVAMTRAQLTPGLLPTGTLPTAGPASGVAVPDAPPTTVVNDQAQEVEVPSARQSTRGKEAVAWDRPEGTGADDKAREGTTGVAEGAHQTKGAAHEVELGALGGGVSSLSSGRRIQGPGVPVTGVKSVRLTHLIMFMCLYNIM